MPGAEWGGAGGRGGLEAVGWSVAAPERSGKVSLEVKTAGELGALRGGGSTGVPRPGGGPSQARGAGPGPPGGRSPNKGSLRCPPWRPSQPPDPAPPKRSGPGIPRLPSQAPRSAAPAPLTKLHVCVPGAPGIRHVPRLQAARRGGRVSATSPPLIPLEVAAKPPPTPWEPLDASPRVLTPRHPPGQAFP